MLQLLDRLSPADRLRLLTFDAELRRLPRPLVNALWAGVDALKRPAAPSQPGRISKCRFCAWVMSVPTRLMKSAWSGEKNARYVRPTSIRPL